MGIEVSAAEVEPLTLERAIELTREVVAEFGPDHVYVKQLDSNEDRTCFYVHDGAPSCLVGHVLHRHGVPPEAFATLEGEAANEVVDMLTDAEERVALFLNTVQIEQDEGAVWGDALEAALSVVNAGD